MNIEDFKNSIGGGVRPALFRVGGRIGSRTNNNLSFLVTAVRFRLVRSEKSLHHIEAEL